VTNTWKDNAITRYFRETWAEMKKVRWPTRQEAQNLTLVVLAVTIAMAAILGLLDAFYSWLFNGLINGTTVNLVVAGAILLAGIVAIIFGMRQ
jgi:preprotein translocase subunit SecE